MPIYSFFHDGAQEHYLVQASVKEEAIDFLVAHEDISEMCECEFKEPNTKELWKDLFSTRLNDGQVAPTWSKILNQGQGLPDQDLKGQATARKWEESLAAGAVVCYNQDTRTDTFFDR